MRDLAYVVKITDVKQKNTGKFTSHRLATVYYQARFARELNTDVVCSICVVLLSTRM